MKKPTVDELLAFAKAEGMHEDFFLTDLRTGERAPVPREKLQAWIDAAWDEEAQTAE